MLAAYGGHVETVEWLLAHGADPNSRDVAWNSILIGAAVKGSIALFGSCSMLAQTQPSATMPGSMRGSSEDVVDLLDSFAMRT